MTSNEHPQRASSSIAPQATAASIPSSDIFKSDPTDEAVGGVKGRAVSNENLTGSAFGIGSGTTPSQKLQISPSTGVVVQNMPNASTVPEFLYQLTRMLSDNNRDTIEWSHGKIEVHNPYKLESHVLNRYFRHSKFASFQRQLNYFGFRKLAGKGKMAPCSYVNEATGNDIGSLLTIKRKTGNETNAAKLAAGKKREREEATSQSKESTNTTPALTGTFTSTPAPGGPVITKTTAPVAKISKGLSFHNGSVKPKQSHHALARVAIGKGVRHGIVASKPSTTLSNPEPLPTNYMSATRDNRSGLDALQNNFRSSLHDSQSHASGQQETPVSMKSEPLEAPSSSVNHEAANNWGFVPGSLAHDDSLVDLAMIPDINDGNGSGSGVETADGGGSGVMPFIDFPWQDFRPDDSSR